MLPFFIFDFSLLFFAADSRFASAALPFFFALLFSLMPEGFIFFFSFADISVTDFQLLSLIAIRFSSLFSPCRFSSFDTAVIFFAIAAFRWRHLPAASYLAAD